MMDRYGEHGWGMGFGMGWWWIIGLIIMVKPLHVKSM